MRFTNQMMRKMGTTTMNIARRPMQMAIRKYRVTQKQQGFGQKRPKFFEKLERKEQGGPFSFFLVVFLIPLVFANQFQRYHIEEAREKGWPQIHRMNARIAKKIREGRVEGPDNSETERILKNYKMDKKTNQKVPEENHYEYILIGGGTASIAALRAIRKNDPNGKILIVCAENKAPYERPPLSKELWENEANPTNHTFQNYKGEQTSIYYDDVNQENVTLLTSTTVTNLNINDKSIKLDSGFEIGYNKCLLATGAEPRVLAQAADMEKVTTFRTIADYDKVAQDLEKNKDKNIVVIGGSFLGTEIAYAIGKKLKEMKSKGTVTQVFLEREVLSRILPTYVSELVKQALENVGVKLVPNVTVGNIEYDNNKEKVKLELTRKNWLSADYVINATGVFPNIELAEQAGLEIDTNNFGVSVNSELEARGEVFVAGDVCSYYDSKFGRRRSEHHDNAMATGKTAGYNMSCEVAGKKKKEHTYQSMFWSGMGKDLHFEAVGQLKAQNKTVAVFEKIALAFEGEQWRFAQNTSTGQFTCHPQSGIIYYLNEKNVIEGILFVNKDKPSFKKARKLIGKSMKETDDFTGLL